MNTYVRYIDPRPLLAVEPTGGSIFNRCYSESTYRVTSRQPLPRAFFDSLRTSGLVDGGQEFGVSLELPDGSFSPVQEEIRWNNVPPPTGHVVLDGTEVDAQTNKPTGRKFPNESNPFKSNYWTYHVTVRCDSSD